MHYAGCSDSIPHVFPSETDGQFTNRKTSRAFNSMFLNMFRLYVVAPHDSDSSRWGGFTVTLPFRKFAHFESIDIYRAVPSKLRHKKTCQRRTPFPAIIIIIPSTSPSFRGEQKQTGVCFRSFDVDRRGHPFPPIQEITPKKFRKTNR